MGDSANSSRVQSGRRLPRAALSALVLAVALSSAQPSAAQSIIKQPGREPRYSFEAEPHLLLAPFNPPGPARGQGFGAGFRGTVLLAREGFIRSVNDSVGIGFGADWVRYESVDARGRCTDFIPGPNGTEICVEVSGSGGHRDHFILPIVMQWDFWLTHQWSLFAEPGLFLRVEDDERLRVNFFTIYAGARYHFSDSVALTMRLGYPTLSIGVSFLL
jgi:hypothetical protein